MAITTALTVIPPTAPSLNGGFSLLLPLASVGATKGIREGVTKVG